MPRPRRRTKPLFEETLRLRDTVYARVAGAVALFLLAGWICVAGAEVRSNAVLVPLFVLTVMSLVSLIPLLLKRVTRVEPDSIHAKFDWEARGKIQLPVEEIVDHRIRPIPDRREWSQGPNQDDKKVRVLWGFTASRGILLTLHGGRRIFIASANPNRFNRAIAQAIRIRRRVL